MSEELRIIMDAIAQLGAEGKQAFIWWLIIKHVVGNAFFVVVVLIVAYVATRIARIVKEHHEECRICRLVYEKTEGPKPSYGYYGLPKQIEAIEKWVKERR